MSLLAFPPVTSLLVQWVEELRGMCLLTTPIESVGTNSESIIKLKNTLLSFQEHMDQAIYGIEGKIYESKIGTEYLQYSKQS